MADPHLLSMFALAVVLLALTPGPNMALIVANSLAYGARWGILTVVATCSASVVQLALVAIGMASAIEHLGGWFGWLRWAGAGYLIVVGIQQFRTASPDLEGPRPQPRSVGRIFGRAAVVSVTNPKTLLFYAAFFPQFLSPLQPALPQLLILAALYVLIAFSVDSIWALAADRVRGLLGKRSRLANRASGTVLVGAGVALAIERVR